MKDMVANYDEMKAPAILVNKMGHNNNKPGFEPGTVLEAELIRELIARLQMQGSY